MHQDEPELSALLLRCQLFHNGLPATRELILRQGRVMRIAAGTAISKRGDPVTSLGVVLTGSIELGSGTSEGKRFVRWFLEPGQLLGLVSVLDGQGAIYDSRAHADSNLLMIPRQTLLQVIATDEQVRDSLVMQFCRTSRQTQDAARQDALYTLDSRIARSILKLADSYGRPAASGTDILLKLSQEEFSAMLAVPRQRVNRTLKKLEDLGYIELAYSRIRVVDSAALLALAARDDLG